MAANGFCCQHQLYPSKHNQHRKCSQFLGLSSYLSSGIKSNTWCARICGLNMVSISTRAPQVDILHRSISRCTTVFELVGEEENRVLNLEQKLPSSGSRVSEGLFSGNEIKVHFLEERNEEVLSNRILGLSRLNKVRSALELHRSMEFSGLRPSLHACNSLLSCLLRNELIDDALKFFEFMKASEIASGHTYSLMLKAIANARGCNAAVSLFEELEAESNVKKDFDVVVYNTMISICGKDNDWVQIARIWRQMKENNHIGTEITYRLLVCTFVRCGQNELALDAYHEMVENKLNPSDDVKQAIIAACGNEGKWHLGLSVFQNMLDCGLKPNLIVCNSLINSLGKAGEVKLAFRVYRLMKSLGHEPDSYTWNALLGGLYRVNRHGDVLRFFESIRDEQSSLLNEHLYNTSLMSCQRLGLWDRALQLMWEMEASGVPVSTASYNLLIGACEVARKPKIALQIYQHMVYKKCAPDTFTLLSLIRCCIWGSLWEEAEEMLNVAPDVSLYNAAIQGMCLRGMLDSARKLYTKMRKSGLEPDGKTRAMMLQSLPNNRFKRRKTNNRFKRRNASKQ